MKKILIIEDEKVLREMYYDKFSKEGIELIVSDNIEDGLRITRTEKPDLVLLDMFLPMKSGVYFLQKLREDQAISSTRVVSFSNFDDPSTKKKAKNLGVLDYLIKTDYTPMEVIKKVKEYLR